jgi:para-nitrobenzyl esterase
MKATSIVLSATVALTSMNIEAMDLSRVVTTSIGAMQGVTTDDKAIDIYKGIPFAKSPLGKLRWQPPQEIAAWDGVKQVTEFKAGCYQAKATERLPWSVEFLHQGEISEDCLYLNIWSPNTGVKSKHPVVVYIHGGGFMEGSGSVPIYDGENLARKGVLFVTLNYRLGAFGFLASSELSAQQNGVSGNYGIQDQIAALKWLKQNISAFGGDANNITIMGQSAGANSVLFLNSSPLTQGLFNRSVIESPTPAFMNSAGVAGHVLLESPFTSTTLAQKSAATDSYLAQKGLSIKELQTMSADAVFKAIDPRVVPLVPAIDGNVLDKSLYEVFTTTHRQKGPIVIGFNQDELSGFFDDYREGSAALFSDYVTANYPTNAKQISLLYPGNGRKALNRDEGKVALKNLAQMLNHYTGNNVYTYYFDQPIDWPKQQGYGTFHTSEVPFILDTLGKVDARVTSEQKQVASLFSDHLVQFAKSGDPSFANQPWRAVGEHGDWLYNINRAASMIAGVDVKNEEAILKLGVK